MKKVINLFGIIALVAIIGFSMAACGDDGGGGSGGGGGGGGISTGGWSKAPDSTFGTSDIFAIAYGGGKFVAGGENGKMAYSSDGVNWRAANSTFSTRYIKAIAYGNGKFVAGDDKGKMAYSSDGINWTPVDTGTTFGDPPEIGAIAFGGGKFVAAGGGSTTGGPDGGDSTIAYSSDGINWTPVNVTSIFPNGGVCAIAYGGGKFVAGGSWGWDANMNLIKKIGYSSDGITWTAADIISIFKGSSEDIYAIAYGNGKFVAVGGPESGDENIIAYSSDGAHWTAADSKLNNGGGYLSAVAFGNNKFVAANDGRDITYSSDGVNWTSIRAYQGYTHIHAIAFGGGKFVAGWGNYILYSTWK